MTSVRPLQESSNHPQNLGIAHLRVVESRSVNQHHLMSVDGERFGELALRCTRNKVGSYFKVFRSTCEICELSKDGQGNS